MKLNILRDPSPTEGGAPAPVTTPPPVNTVTTIVHRVEIDASALAKLLQAHHIVLGILIGTVATLIVVGVIHFAL